MLQDIAPKAPVHLLLIPKVHVASLNDLKDEHKDVMAHLTMAIPQVRKMGIKESGIG